MTVGDLIKQLENEDKNKIVLFKDSMNGWCNLKKAIGKAENEIVLYEDTDLLFDD